jgi:hypothetical protein
MKKMPFKLLAIALLTMSFSAHAELPNINNTQVNNPYNQYNQYNGYNNGYNQFNYPVNYGSGAYGGYGSSGYGMTAAQQQQMLSQQQMASGQKAQKAYNTYMTGKDLLWVFTGDEGSFGKRLFFMFSGVLDRKFVQPVENTIGSLEQNRQLGVTPVATQTPYMNQGLQYCYDCTQQNSTNPYATNQNALNPALFGGNTTSSGSTGGIRK